jgi:hypothetical protein
MANSHVQGTGVQGGNVTSLSKAYTSNVTAGNLLVVGIIGNKSAAAPTFTGTPPSGNSNTFLQRVTNLSPSGTSRADVWSAKNCNGGATTILVTPSASSFISLGIAEDSGADTTAPEGNTGTGGATSTAPATGTITVATAGEIIYGVVSQEGSTATITVAGGGTEIFENESVTNMPINWQWKIVSVNSTVSWTLGSSQPWLCAAAAFKAGATTVKLPAPYIVMNALTRAANY